MKSSALTRYNFKVRNKKKKRRKTRNNRKENLKLVNKE